MNSRELIRIDVQKDLSQDDVSCMLVSCPECGQKLADVHFVDGLSVLRIRCRRCKCYVVMSMIGKR